MFARAAPSSSSECRRRESSSSSSLSGKQKQTSDAVVDEFADATWDLRFDAFSVSTTLFVDPAAETQMIFAFLPRKNTPPPRDEAALAESVIKAGGGVFLADAHDAGERRGKIDAQDWPRHRDVHLLPTKRPGPRNSICAKCDALIVSVHYVFECARANRLFALVDFRVAPERPFLLHDPPLSERWKRFRRDSALYQIQGEKKAKMARSKAKRAERKEEDEKNEDEAQVKRTRSKAKRMEREDKDVDEDKDEAENGARAKRARSKAKRAERAFRVFGDEDEDR